MKSKLFLSSLLVAIAFMFTFTACDPDEDPIDEPVLVEDGIYVYGTGTGNIKYAADALMKATRNEKTQTERTQLLESYVAVKAGADGFHIVIVEGGKPKLYGPGDNFATVDAADKTGQEPTSWFARGGIKESATPFTVTEDGLYHVVYDTELKVAVVAKADWGIIGAATPGGWGANTALTGAFDLNTMTLQATEIIMLAADWKFRYSNGWKIVLDETYDLGDGVMGVLVNTNFGGAIDALVPGGGNIVNAEPGYYTISMTWTRGAGFTASITKTGTYTPPSFPDAVYLVGDASFYGWDTPGTKADAIMHKCADASQNDGIFWKIAYLETGKGFKISEENWGTVNVGFGQVDEFDASGVTVSDNGGNMSVAESGMYMIVLNLQDDMVKVSVVAPSVYGIGDAFGSWDGAVAANKFTVDNTAKNLVSPALPAAGNIRMYAAHAWIAAWWNAEFNVYEGKIEYRNDGGDQAAVPGTAGQVVTLHFDDNTGSIQ
jgi:hypothetical protein